MKSLSNKNLVFFVKQYLQNLLSNDLDKIESSPHKICKNAMYPVSIFVAT